MQKKIIAVLIAVLVIAAGILALVNRENSEDKPGMIIMTVDKEISVAWDDIDAQAFEGDFVNGEGETSHHEYTGAELRAILTDKGVEITDDNQVTVTAEDDYSADLTGSEILEAGKVYVALTEDGEMIEGIKGGQGAQLIVLGDPDRKRAVRYLNTVTVK